MTSTFTQAHDGNAVTMWFGENFNRLHPLLQALHRRGGKLSGPVALRFGTGLTGVLGHRLARKLGIPAVAGQHQLDVEIGHDATTLHWRRRFDLTHHVHSSFHPHGHWPDGHWIEHIGPFELKLAVDVIDGGWHWRTIAVRLHGLRVPLWLVPRSTAYKRIEEGRYRFFVGFSLPILGEVFSYSGLLETSPHE